MADLLRRTRKLNGLGDRSIVEPFGGGAGASLSLLYLEDAPQIWINDADPAIHNFWWSVMNRQKEFQNLLLRTPLTIAEWKRQREIYRRRSRVSRVKRGFAAFFLNRCNRSGIIINGGPIGGIRQEGKWKLNARFNRSDLQRRCERIHEYRERISVSCRDGIELIGAVDPSDTFYFIDPPYFSKGRTLYLDLLDREYHVRLARQLQGMPYAKWILTYDDCDEIRELYREWAQIRPFSMRYIANRRVRGKELLIAPNTLKLPSDQRSGAVSW